jgi:hypothetical protein
MLSKKQVYLVLAMFLWAVVFDIVYDIAAISYWNAVAGGAAGKLMELGSGIFDAPYMEIIVVLVGAAAGRRAGEGGWRFIYVEDRRHKKYKLDW